MLCGALRKIKEAREYQYVGFKIEIGGSDWGRCGEGRHG